MGALKADETVLIHSVGGGVGIAATQIAKHVGARVIGTASAVKHDEMRALGVDHLIDYRTEDFETRTREITGGRGVELILDAVGGESWKKGYRVLAPTGRLGCLAFLRSRAARNAMSCPCFQCSPIHHGFSSIRLVS
jgi:synaptic vesicle membrane protein VAT-1